MDATLGNRSQIASGPFAEAMTLERQGHWSGAKDQYRKLANDEDAKVRTLALIRRARCLLETSRWNETNEAEELLVEAKAAVAQLNDLAVEGQYLLQRGRLDDQKGMLKRALDRFHEAYEALKAAGADMIEAELVLASAERRRGELAKALERLERIDSRKLEVREQADYYDEKGAVLLARGETRKAIELLEGALRLDEDTGAASSSGRSRLLLAEACMRAGDKKRAKDLIEETIELYEADWSSPASADTVGLSCMSI